MSKILKKAVRRANPGLPLVLVGESMGGAIALQATAADPELVDGLICSVPSRRNRGQNSTKVLAALGMLYRPNHEMAVGDKVIKRATQQTDVAEVWENDPMTRKDYSPRELMQFRTLMNSSQAKAPMITNTPVLFLQGGSDKLIKPTGTVTLFNHLKTSDKDLVMVGTAEHLILEQGQFDSKKLIKDDVIALMTDWIDKHVVYPQIDVESQANDTKGSAISGQEYSDITRQARGHYKVAEGELLLNDPEAARDHLVTVLRLARGTALAQKADQALLNLPEHLIAPPVGATQHANAQLLSLNAAKSNDKPSILIFCAPWIESCKTILGTVHAALGADEDKVNIVWIDADKEESQAILDEYGVKPLPAVLYLNRKNQVLLYTLADAGVAAVRSRMRLLLAADAKLQKDEGEKEVSTP